MELQEKWLNIADIKRNYYKIRSNGDIIIPSKNNMKMKPFLSNRGYLRINLVTISGRQRKYSVHRLVALMFIPNKDRTLNIVNHKDGNKLNVDVSNLEWSNNSLNMIHAYDNDLAYTKGSMCHLSKPEKYSDNLINEICYLAECGYKTTDIIYKLKLVEPIIPKSSREFQTYKHYINDLRGKKHRREIVSQYDI